MKCPPSIPPGAQQSGRKDFRFRRGDTPVLGLRLWGRDPLTQQVALLPVPGSVVAWVVDWPSRAERKTTELNGGLVVDPDSGFITYPITEANLADLDAEGAPIATRVQLIADDGFAITYLDGTVALYGDE